MNDVNAPKLKGIVLAGGKGTRLYPLTLAISKQLLAVYDKPMIYYPLSILMLAGIRDILIISTQADIPLMKRVLDTGEQWGITISYEVQHQPNGIAEALIIAENFLDGSPCCLILGDNIFYGTNFPASLMEAGKTNPGATIFAYQVHHPERYGVVELNDKMEPISLVEKPAVPKSRYAVTGLYFYDAEVCQWAKTLKPSKRGELEITDLNQIYLERHQLKVVLLGRGIAWLDTGTHESLLEASGFIHALEKRQGLKIACLEEIAYNKGWIDRNILLSLSQKYTQSSYGDYLNFFAQNG